MLMQSDGRFVLRHLCCPAEFLADEFGKSVSRFRFAVGYEHLSGSGGRTPEPFEQFVLVCVCGEARDFPYFCSDRIFLTEDSDSL